MMVAQEEGRLWLEEEVGYNWEELNKLAKQIERDLDADLSALAVKQPSSVGQVGESVQLARLDSNLRQLSHVIDMMSELLEQLNSPVNHSSSASHLLNRHREVYMEYQRDLRKLRNQLSKSREHAELLASVREDIDAYNSPKNISSEHHYAQERSRIDSAHNQADTIIDMAQHARSGLISQKSMLGSAYGRLQEVAERFPIVNHILGRIRVRRRRDQMILGIVIALCIFILFTF